MRDDSVEAWWARHFAWQPTAGIGKRCPRKLKKRLKNEARIERGRSKWWAMCLTWAGWERGIERRGTHPRARHEVAKWYGYHNTYDVRMGEWVV